MNFKRNRSRRIQLPEVSLTPLIDTALTLLIIFMITTPVIQDSIRLNLPETKNNHAGSPQLTKEPTVLSISPDGIFLNDKKITLSQLRLEVKKKVDRSVDKNVIVRGDKGVVFDKIIQVVDELQTVEGVQRVDLATKHSNKT